MKLIFGGGGDEHTSFESHKLFFEQLHPTKKVLYIPVAILSEKHSAEDSLEWFTKAFAPFSLSKIDMLTNLTGVSEDLLTAYDGIYIGGGNVFKLLKEIRDSDFDKLLINYLKGPGIVYGGSAGAIIFGKDVSTAHFFDPNHVNLVDMDGFNFLNRYSLWCHYNPKDIENIGKLINQGHKVIAIEENSALFLNDGQLTKVGEGVHLFSTATEQSFAATNLQDLR